jgi:hypothetical protein
LEEGRRAGFVDRVVGIHSINAVRVTAIFIGPHDESANAHPGCMIPDELLARWQDLPALGWLARRRLSGTIGALPVVGPVARWSGWLLTLVDLVGMRADHAVGSYRHVAVVTVQQRWPVRVRWRYWVAGLVAVVPVSLVFVAVPVFVTVVGVVVARIGAPVVGSVLVFLGWSVCGVTFLLGFASVASGLRSLASGGRRRARAWAGSTGTRLVEAALLAADETDRRAATVLVRPLLRHADEHHIAVIAVPRSDAVARMYEVLGFTHTSDAGGRVLLRVPRSTRSRARDRRA